MIYYFVKIIFLLQQSGEFDFDTNTHFDKHLSAIGYDH